MGAVYLRQTNTYLPIFYFLPAERATKQHPPPLQPQTWGLMLLAHCGKRSLQHSTCSGNANGSGLPAANNYLFADLLLFTSGEGDKATSPSFTAENSGIDASSALLEALIATLYMKWGCEWEQFPTANNYLFANLLLFTSGEGDEATSPYFKAC